MEWIKNWKENIYISNYKKKIVERGETFAIIKYIHYYQKLQTSECFTCKHTCATVVYSTYPYIYITDISVSIGICKHVWRVYVRVHII